MDSATSPFGSTQNDILSKRYQICALRKASKNPTEILKINITTSTIILNQVAESIDPTYHHDQLYFVNSGAHGINIAPTYCQMPLLVFIGWERNSFPDYHFARPLDRTIKGNFSF